MSFYKKHAPNHREHARNLPDLSQYEGMKDQRDESAIPSAYAEKEKKRIKELGLEPADSIEDKSDISCFQRGSSPHWSGINTFLKLPYVEDVRKVGEYDVAFVGAPFDIGCTFRTGTRFGPQGMRRISSLYQKYSYEHAIDLGETLAMCDVGDIFCPANITKGHDQITKGVAHILSQGTLPMIMGGDHSIGYPIARGVAQCVEGNVGIIHVDRHVDTQDKDMDEIMHTCPWFHATNIPNCPPKNLVQLGIGGWQVPRAGVKVGRDRGTTILTVNDIEKPGPDTARTGAKSRIRHAILAWLEQRILRLWQEKRAREAARIPSARNEPLQTQPGVWSGVGLGAGGQGADPAAGRMRRAG